MRNTEDTISKKRDFSHYLEIVVIVFLGITAICTAWATWVGSLHNSNQITNYAISNNLSAEAKSLHSEGLQHLTQDITLWNNISGLLIDYYYAKLHNDSEFVEEISWKIEALVKSGTDEDLRKAIAWSVEQSAGKKTLVSPFEMKVKNDKGEEISLVESYFSASEAKLEESEKYLEQGKVDNQNSGNFGLVTVIYAVVMFIFGIDATIKSVHNRAVLFTIAFVGFVFATFIMLSLPLPDDFSIFF